MALPRSRPSSRAVTAIFWRKSSRRSSSCPGVSIDVGDLRELHEVAVGGAQRQFAQARHLFDARAIHAHADVHDAIAFEHARCDLAEHGGVDGGGHVAGGEAEALRGRAERTAGSAWAGEDEAVENVDDALDLLELLGDVARGLFQKLDIGGEEFHFDRLRRPRQVADEVAENSGEIPFVPGDRRR